VIQVKNHFVPSAYLKNWADQDGNTYVYKTLVANSKTNKWKKHHVNAIAYVRNLYTRKIAGKDNDELEKWFNKAFESPAIPSIKKAIADEQLTKIDWENLINYLACQDVRTPIKLFQHLKWMEKVVPEELDKIMQSLSDRIKNYDGNKHTEVPSYDFPLRVEKNIREGDKFGTIKAETYIGRSTWFFSIKHLLNKTAKVLHNYKWTIIEPCNGMFWPTSDNPVVKLNSYDNGEYDLKGGWGVPNGVIFLPLGPQHLMFAQIDGPNQKKGYQCTELETTLFRKMIIENSHRMVFSRIEDNDVSLFKERIIDSNQVKKEQSQFLTLVKENEELENEFQ
jgi:hypothetical protein